MSLTATVSHLEMSALNTEAPANAVGDVGAVGGWLAQIQKIKSGKRKKKKQRE